MPITTTEIARICNVSRGTVDRALNGRGGINPQTRSLILKTAEAYGYVPHLLASSLATGKTHSIGIIVFDLNSRHFSQLVSSVQQTLSPKGIFPYICITDKKQELERTLVKDLISRKVDGMIIAPISQDPAFSDMLAKWGKPVVTVNNLLSDDFAFVGGNGNEAVYAGMDHFYTHGYREVYFICPPYRRLGQENLFAQTDRVTGFNRFLKEHADMCGSLIAQKTYLSEIFEIVPKKKRPVGFFCSSDHYALQIYKEARNRGFSIPRDFGLMGFDGIDTLDYLDKRITTIFYPAEKIGRLSAECLYDMISHDAAPKRMIVECPIIPGDTIGQ